MKSLKIACWNVEWLGHLWPDLKESKYHVDRRVHVADEINMVDADVLCIEEGPGNPSDMKSYVEEFLPKYKLVLRPEG